MKLSKETPLSTEDLFASAEKLAEILANDPDALDEDILSRGEQWLDIKSFDPESDEDFPDMNEKKILVLQNAIKDLAQRGKLFTSAFLGLTYYEGSLQPFIAQYGEIPLGDVYLSIEFKRPDLLAQWRQGDLSHIDDDEINYMVYYLTWYWAQYKWEN